ALAALLYLLLLQAALLAPGVPRFDALLKCSAFGGHDFLLSQNSNSLRRGVIPAIWLVGPCLGVAGVVLKPTGAPCFAAVPVAGAPAFAEASAGRPGACSQDLFAFL